MYQVIVADDEPMAIQSIRTIVEKRSHGYIVADVAENGQEALQKIREKKPDLVICDIKMPFLSGVELAEIIRREFPDICVIIVSGYQDFEYAQSAVRSGVTDYILKPVVPSGLLKSLEFARERIRQIHYEEQKKLLRAMGNGETVDLEKLKHYLPHRSYYGAIVRRNGLPRRFSLDKTREIYSDINEQYVIFGRDEMESLYLIPESLIREEDFLQYLEKLKGQQNPQDYYTLIYDPVPFSPEQMQEKIRNLYQTLDQVSSVGVTQSLNVKEDIHRSSVSPELRKKEEQILISLETAARGKNTEQVLKELKRGYHQLTADEPPQIWLEHFTREVLSIMRQHGLSGLSMSESEYLLNDAFFYATSVDGLTDSLKDVLVNLEKDTGQGKVDSREYFETIERYLERNLAEELSLQELCRQFGISQTYMSRMFRKYSGNSFNQYLTELRMDRAKQLFQENPEGYIKDVAAMVGYRDQFYFSRIFRTYTGKSPSEYLKECSAANG